MLGTVALMLLWVWWVRRSLRRRYLAELVEAARGDPRRATRVTVRWQSAAALLGILLIAIAMVAQIRWDQPAVRVTLLLVVIALLVPFSSIAAGRDESRSRPRRVQVRRSAQRRLGDAGADPAVADAVVRAGRPFAVLGFLLGVVAAVLLFWHG